MSLLFSLLSLVGCTTTAGLLEKYTAAPKHKAFALADGGQSGASWGNPNIATATHNALDWCRKSGGAGCRIVQINDASINTSGSSSMSKTKRVYTCSDLSEGEAYVFMLSGHSYLDRDGDGHPCEWGKGLYVQRAAPAARQNCHWVKGHYRSGRYVKGYRRCR